MGMYTEIDLEVKLDLNTRNDIVNWLDVQANNRNSEDYDLIYEKNIPNEFKYTRVSSLLRGIIRNECILEFTKEKDCYFLHTNFEIKNYEDELELLVNTLKPYILNRGVIGTLLYEEYDTPGDIIYNEGEEIDYNYGTLEYR